MRMEDLRYLIQVADSGSISQAAEAWRATSRWICTSIQHS